MSEGEPQWTVSLNANRSTSSWSNFLQINSTDSGWLTLDVFPQILVPRNIHQLERQQLALRSQEDLIHQSAQRVQPQAPVLTRTSWPLRSRRKYLRARNIDIISRKCMCQEKWCPLHRPYMKWPSMTTVCVCVCVWICKLWQIQWLVFLLCGPSSGAES